MTKKYGFHFLTVSFTNKNRHGIKMFQGFITNYTELMCLDYNQNVQKNIYNFNNYTCL